MPGGRYDSSKTRVAPVFDALAHSSSDWVRELLGLVTPPDGALPPPMVGLDLRFLGGHWGDGELGLDPPVSLLHYLIDHVSNRPGVPMPLERCRLLHGSDDERRAARAAAHALLTRGPRPPRAWFVFEGPTVPDVRIKTPDALIVIEGKRTERGPTTETTWMPGRHQMWRHIDAAWEAREERQVWGFFLVEGAGPDGTEIPVAWTEASKATIDPQTVAASLPHRSEAERAALASCFLGVSSWQRVCRHFGYDPASLPDTVADLPCSLRKL